MSDVQKILDGFKDPVLAKKLVDSIHSHRLDLAVSLMEVCGTHTMSIARAGIRDLMPENVTLKSGPGCPVCVTSNSDIDKIIALASLKDVIIATFGDMMRVPGSSNSLYDCMANGSDVRVCYSPMDALTIAQDNKSKSVIFIGVGFETTAPLVAMTIKRAEALNLDNFFVYCAHKNMPGAIETIINDPETRIDGLILPGHVTTIIGCQPYEFLVEKYGVPGAVTGFEPVDILKSIDDLLSMIETRRPEIKNDYQRGVNSSGNKTAVQAINDVFDVCDATWRGIGVIKMSGFCINERFARFDAMRAFGIEPEPTKENSACRCGDVLRSIITPDECPLFKTVCNPENPVGPCMVSSEGSCAAYYRYY